MPQSSATPAPVRAPAPRAGAHVLLVIEHIWLSSVIADLLAICVGDIDVHEAGTRADALALVRDIPVKVIVIDANRSDDAVLPLVRELGAAAPHARLIVLEDRAARPECAALSRCTAIRKEDTASRLPALIAAALDAGAQATAPAPR